MAIYDYTPQGVIRRARRLLNQEDTQDALSQLSDGNMLDRLNDAVDYAHGLMLSAQRYEMLRYIDLGVPVGDAAEYGFFIPVDCRRVAAVENLGSNGANPTLAKRQQIWGIFRNQQGDFLTDGGLRYEVRGSQLYSVNGRPTSVRLWYFAEPPRLHWAPIASAPANANLLPMSTTPEQGTFDWRVRCQVYVFQRVFIYQGAGEGSTAIITSLDPTTKIATCVSEEGTQAATGETAFSATLVATGGSKSYYTMMPLFPTSLGMTWMTYRLAKSYTDLVPKGSLVAEEEAKFEQQFRYWVSNYDLATPQQIPREDTSYQWGMTGFGSGIGRPGGF